VRLVLLGPPGAGKGTQAIHIAAAFDVPRIATGDIFRENVKQGTPLGREAHAYMERGDLVPDDVVIRMVRDRLQRDDVAPGFLLDGFPRTVPQAVALEDFLADVNRPLDVVLRFQIPEDDVVRRIVHRRVCPACGAVFHLEFAPPKVDGVCDACGGELVHRKDDTEEVVRHRLEEYHRKTEPLEFFYWERGLLRDIEATGAVDEVTARTLAVLRDVRSGAENGDAA
jgi:adenylate kinase